MDTSEKRLEILAKLKEGGLTISECIGVLADPNDNPFVVEARKLCNEEFEIDDSTLVSQGDDPASAFVLCWRFVRIDLIADVFEKVLNAVLFVDHSLSPLDRVYRDWLEDLITNYADELDNIENEILKAAPGSITWVDGAGNSHTFMPSTALFRLHLLAKSVGKLDNETATRAEQFIVRYGNKLDAILTVIQTA